MVRIIAFNTAQGWSRDVTENYAKPAPSVERDELLNETLFTSLAQVRVVLNAWKDDYNNARPHSALGNLTPAEFAAHSAPGPQRGGALRFATGSAPRPVASPSPLSSNVIGTLPIAG